MDGSSGPDVVHRWVDNPLIAIEDIPFRCSDVWNAGVVHVDGEYILLITIESLQGQPAIYQARSRDGKHFSVDPEPFLAADPTRPCRYETSGLRDPRITRTDGVYYVTYVADSPCGLRVGLARTEDFRSVERLGIITEPDTKGGALFPEKINGRYALLERPNPGLSIWLSYSDDLEFWGSSVAVMTPRDGYWDCHRIGLAGPPLGIDTGWLLIYYGEKSTSAGPLMRLGAAILDAEDPSKVVARSNIPILSPREPYERIGDVPNVVYSCGAILEADGTVRIYYGGSDSCICAGTAKLDDIIDICLAGTTEL
jgi:predicted GH43/DUF377 family glycosyl hydrolase